MIKQPTEDFKALAHSVCQNGSAVPLTTRELLSHFGQTRSGKVAIRSIRYQMKKLGVETQPSLCDAGYDSIIQIVPRQKRGCGRPRKFGTNPRSTREADV